MFCYTECMREKTPKSAYIALGAFALVLLAAVLLVAGILRYYVPGFLEAVRTHDEAAIEAFFESQDHLQSYLLMWFLAYVQVISIVIPAAVVHVAAGAVLGSVEGTLVVYTAELAAHMTVFFIARHARKLLLYISQERPTFGRLLNSLQFNENRTYYIAMALLTPGLPNWIIPYAAANSRMKPYTFLLALLIALPLPIYFTCLAADFLTHGDYLFSIISIASLYLFVGLLFIGRRRIPGRLKDLWVRLEERKYFH